MSDLDYADALASFFDEGLLNDILFEVKSGKEATVYCCRGSDLLHGDLIAAKVYRPLESRRFKNDAVYQGGRVHMARNSRVRRATMNKSRFGHKVQYGMWLEHEWETMNVLFDAGADVLEPIARNDRAILMPFVGDESGAAPILNDVELPLEEAATVLDRLLWNVERMLTVDRVHGDLSPYNILLDVNAAPLQALLIDFPQAIDPRLNRNGRSLLLRDLDRLCTWGRRMGVNRPAERIGRRLWTRFAVGEIG